MILGMAASPRLKTTQVGYPMQPRLPCSGLTARRQDLFPVITKLLLSDRWHECRLHCSATTNLRLLGR
ncbi:MAG: hypothetical protein K0Q60_4584 [Microvirga sp.]|jgi:hypothetical protein|nr:hypothetical protein [Microvirga sp.]